MTEYEHLLDLMRARRSIRRFAPDTVSREQIVRLIEAARWAPSNHNRQAWRFLVLEDTQQIAALAETISRSLAEKLKLLPAVASAYLDGFVHGATFFAQAPVLIVALHKRPASVSAALLKGVDNPALVSGEPLSVAMAVQNLVLAAHALGLGTCVLTGPLVAQEVVADALNLPAGHDITCLVALGHPAEMPLPPRRKSLEQIVEFRSDAERPAAGKSGNTQ